MKNKCIVFFILVAILINLFSFHNAQDWGDDFAGYVIQAKTIASGTYAALEDHIQKTDYILNYPWGFPLLISPVIGYFQTNMLIIKICIFTFFVLSLVVMFRLFREEKENALMTILLFAACPYFWLFKNYILADFPNLFFVSLSLLLAQHVIVKRKIIGGDYFSYFLIGLCIFVSCMMRSQSFILLPVIALVQLVLYRRGLDLKIIISLLIPLLTYLCLSFLFSFLIPVQPVHYLEQYQNLELWKTIRTNIFYYINVWKELFNLIAVIKECVDVFTGFFITFVAIGFFTSFRKNFLFAVFFGASLLLVLVSPFYQGVRYLIPALPFFFYFFVSGFRYAVYKISTSPAKANAWYYITTALIVFLSLYTNASYSYEQLSWEHEGPYKKTSQAAFDFVRKNSSPQEVMAFWKPRAMLLYTDRNTVVPLSYERCIEKHVKYFIYYKNAYDQIPLETITSHAGSVSEVYRNEDYIILKFL